MGVSILMAEINAQHRTSVEGVATSSWGSMNAGDVGEWIVPPTGTMVVHVDVEGDGLDTVVAMEGANAAGCAGAPLLDPAGLAIRLRGGQLARIDTPTLFVRPAVEKTSAPVNIHLSVRPA
jgi:hypothetical protein